MDPVRELPYRLAAITIAASEAGQMAASDERVRPLQKLLASKGASTDGKLTQSVGCGRHIRRLPRRPRARRLRPSPMKDGHHRSQFRIAHAAAYVAEESVRNGWKPDVRPSTTDGRPASVVGPKCVSKAQTGQLSEYCLLCRPKARCHWTRGEIMDRGALRSLQAKATRCRELALRATDPEAAEALQELALDMERAILLTEAEPAPRTAPFS
jgi:hypothetical protein